MSALVKKSLDIDAEFINGTPAERVIDFNLFDDMTAVVQGEMLEIMFQAKDYQDLGYNNFNDFVDSELSISSSSAKRFRNLYASKVKLTHETDSKLKEEDKLITRKELHGGVTYKSVKAEALADEVVELAQDKPEEVITQLKNKSIGMDKKKEVLESDLSMEDMVTALKSKDGYKEVMGVDDTRLSKGEKDKLSSTVQARLERLEKENKELKAENRKLKAMVKMDELTEELMKFVKNVYHSYRFITESKKSNERLFQTRLLPHVESALETLEMATNIESDLDDLKKAYRVMAKKHHPDKGGNQDAFVEIKKAYDTLKKYIK